MDRNASLLTGRRGVVLTVAVTAATGVFYAISRPQKGVLGFIDHFVSLGTVQRMRHGAGFYRAFTDAAKAQGITISEPRGYRMPTIFLFWRLFPTGWLYGLYIAVVVVGTVTICCFLVRYAVAAIPVGLYLLLTGRRLINGTTLEGWLLVELWALPAVAGCLVAARRERPWLAALLAALAACIREVAVVLLVAGLFDAAFVRRSRRAVEPWLVGLAIFAAAFALHSWIASGFTAPVGNQAALIDTGTGVRTALESMTYRLPTWLGLALFVIALVRLKKVDQLFPAVGLFLIPVVTLFINRNYWGLLLIPFTILFSTDWLIEILATRSYDWRSHGATPARRNDP
jgi:hypothetical protein